MFNRVDSNSDGVLDDEISKLSHRHNGNSQNTKNCIKNGFEEWTGRQANKSLTRPAGPSKDYLPIVFEKP